MEMEALFNVEPILVHYTQAVGNRYQYPGARKDHHVNVVEQAVQGWRIGADWEDVLAELNYKGNRDDLRTYPR